MDHGHSHSRLAAHISAELYAQGGARRAVSAHEQPNLSARLDSGRLLFASRHHVCYLLEDFSVGQVSH